MDFFTGDRASDLGWLSCNQVFRLRDQEGFLIRLSFTEIVHRGSPRQFFLVPFRDPDVCPVLWLDYYVCACQVLGFSLPEGYFSELPTVGSGSGKGHFLVRQFIIVYVCISLRRNM